MFNYGFEFETYGAGAEEVSSKAHEISMMAHGLFGKQEATWDMQMGGNVIEVRFLRRSDHDRFVERLGELDCPCCGHNRLMFA